MLEVIKNRRACRSFASTPIEQDKIEEIVNAGLLAPSGMNRQTSVILVITDKKKRDQLAELNRKLLGRPVQADTFYNAPVILLVMSHKDGLSTHDGAATIENMLLEATNQGLASCWIHRAKEELETEEFKEMFKDLNINFDEYIGIGHVILGYLAKDWKANEKIIRDNRVYYI